MNTTQNGILDTQWYSYSYDSEHILFAQQKALRNYTKNNYTQCISCNEKNEKFQEWKTKEVLPARQSN